MAQSNETHSSLPHLFSPLEMGDLTLPNRIVMAPLTRARSGEDRVPNDMMASYYSQRALAGLIISEATVVSPQGIGWSQTPGIYNDAMTEGWRRVVDSVHDHGGRIFLQLWHTGRASHSAFHGGELPVAPSAIAIEGDHSHTPEGKKPYETPRALDTDEIPGIVDDYRNAARRAKEAGFDGVEVHSANGYLLDTFLQSKTNHRSDQYGGNTENRYRMLGEVVDAVTEIWPASRVGVRLAPNGSFNDMGSPDYREQFTYVAAQLNTYGLAYLHVMDGTGFGFHELGPAMTLSDFRQVFSGPLMGNVDYTAEKAETAIAEGDAELIAFGRPFISNPDLVQRFANGWPLADTAPMDVWYSHGKAGYTDFPPYQPDSATVASS
ncbi:N-ethylmaleimide reductase [Crateriforma conspicua]|uniref:N-ethylmaleimide reductase n=1 Tax=Crateriforma conspicua TaxID=2527996 RepID=A0A5C6FN29_9PLAN|nr:alkene reductase [Crateriforma conspicua]TWU61763.1 N-ethylmaleimide reductase [Crateriforma conspicua]